MLLKVEHNARLYFGDQGLQTLVEHALRANRIGAAARHLAQTVYGRIARVRYERVLVGLLERHRAHVEIDEKEALIPSIGLRRKLVAQLNTVLHDIYLVICRVEIH